MDIREPDTSSDSNDGGQQPGTQQSGAQTNRSSGGGSVFGSVLLIIGLIVLVAAGVYFFGDFSKGVGGGSGPVAKVAGEPIERETFQQQLNNLRQSTSSQAQQFQSLSNKRQQELVLAGIINRELLRQAAQQSGASVSKSEVDQELQNRIDQIGGEQAFKQQLQSNDVTRKEIRENLREQLLVNKYVSQAVGTSTDQQVQQLYNQYTQRLRQQSGTSTPQIPSLEQLRPQLEASIQQQAQQQLLQQARQNLNVEVLIDGVSYPPTSQQGQQQGAQQTGGGQTGGQNAGQQSPTGGQ